MKKLLTLLVLLFAGTCFGQADRWKGLVIDETTPAQAITLLGKPVRDEKAPATVLEFQRLLSNAAGKPTFRQLSFGSDANVDLYSTPKESESYYMYASDYMIGMKRDNYTDLTEKLDKEWGIWHETGHTHQQDSWTWGSIGEISVNLFSLYVQEKFGLPTRLNTIEGGETETTFNKARKYIANPNKNYLAENEADYNELFSKLVMFHQLKTVYGWDSIKKLHQYFRKNQYVENGDETDQDQANKFIYAMCLITKNNLVPFFKKWGLNVDSATSGKIKGLNLPLPTVDATKIFR